MGAGYVAQDAGAKSAPEGNFKERAANHLENSYQQVEREPVGEGERKEYLAAVNHNDLSDIGKTKTKQCEIVAGPLMWHTH